MITFNLITELTNMQILEEQVLYDSNAKDELGVECEFTLCLKVIVECTFNTGTTITIPIYLYKEDVWNYPGPFNLRVPNLTYMNTNGVPLSHEDYIGFMRSTNTWVRDGDNGLIRKWYDAVKAYSDYFIEMHGVIKHFPMPCTK